MRIACLYYPTSSVGGIATNVATLREEARRRGDTFHVLVSANAKTHRFEVFSKPKFIRGGDTFISVDGYAPHHQNNAKSSARRLKEDYDILYLAFLCPHPTKSYGDEAEFLNTFDALSELGDDKPIVGRISDGYYDTYREWGDAMAGICDRMIIADLPYVPEGFRERFPDLPIVLGRPFGPEGPGFNAAADLERSEERSLAWVSQWKAIKGIHRLLPLLPGIPGEQRFYSNGILYYQLRSEPEWKAAFGKDHFKPEFSGDGKAEFFGWQEMPVIRVALRRAWFMPEFQGLGRPSYAAYRKGSMNNTMMEALYYGTTPVIPQMTIDAFGIPPESVIGVTDYDQIVAALSGPRAARPELGRDWVMDRFAVSKVYDQFFGGLV